MTRHFARYHIVGMASCVLLASATAIGCDKGPRTTPDPIVTALRIEGNLQLAGPNETSQLRAFAVMSAGPARDVTTLATWRTVGGENAVVVSEGGLLESFSFGTGVVTVTYQNVKTTVNVRVMPQGMHMLSGFVREAGALPVPDAFVTVVDGPSAGRETTTDAFGRFNLTPVGGDIVTVQVSSRAYQSTTRTFAMAGDLRDVELVLVPFDLPMNLAGVYDLTIDASPICELPEVLMRRRYKATIGQDGARLDVTLSGATFRPCFDNLGQADHFDGRVFFGNTVSFELGRDDRGCKRDVYERIGLTSYLDLAGTASGTATDRQITLTWMGSLQLLAEPPSGQPPAVLASCFATHRMIFER